MDYAYRIVAETPTRLDVTVTVADASLDLIVFCHRDDHLRPQAETVSLVISFATSVGWLPSGAS